MTMRRFLFVVRRIVSSVVERVYGFEGSLCGGRGVGIVCVSDLEGISRYSGFTVTVFCGVMDGDDTLRSSGVQSEKLVPSYQ